MSSSPPKLSAISVLMLFTLGHVLFGMSPNPRFLIALMVSGLWGYFDKDRPFWVRITWWGCFLHGMNDSVRQARRVCESCIIAKQNPITNCGDSIRSLNGALISIFIFLAIRYHYNWSWRKVSAESTAQTILSEEDRDANNDSDSI